MTKAERLARQLERLTEMKKYEEQLHEKGYRYIAGVDEAGRGPLAGPVVAAAVILPADFDVPGVDDSKKLSEKKRLEMFDIITEKALAYGIGIADNMIIDEINILQATKQAMKSAISSAEEKLRSNLGAEDGAVDYVLFDAMQIDEVKIPQESIIKGDSKILAIAAASIIAKVTRDRMMKEFAETYPGYSFEKNKGYGTKEHYAGIYKNGICPIHRKTFLRNLKDRTE